MQNESFLEGLGELGAVFEDENRYPIVAEQEWQVMPVGTSHLATASASTSAL
jgi:hypothetical protein